MLSTDPKNAFIGINDEDATEQKTLDKEQKALVVWLVTRAEKALWWRKKEDVQVIDLYKADLIQSHLPRGIIQEHYGAPHSLL